MALFYLEPLLIRPLRTFFGSTDDAKCPIWVMSFRAHRTLSRRLTDKRSKSEVLRSTIQLPVLNWLVGKYVPVALALRSELTTGPSFF